MYKENLMIFTEKKGGGSKKKEEWTTIIEERASDLLSDSPLAFDFSNLS